MPCTGIITWLKYPYPRLVEEPSLYETVKLHAQYGKKRFLEKSSFSVSGVFSSACIRVKILEYDGLWISISNQSFSI